MMEQQDALFVAAGLKEPKEESGEGR